MENLDSLLLTSLNDYFNVLSKLGYINYCIVGDLIVSLFLNDVLNGLFGMVSEEDYKDIENCLYCIYGRNCLIPYNQYSILPVNSGNVVDYLRITESDIVRNTENNYTRIVS